MGIPMLNIRQSWVLLIFNIGIPYIGKTAPLYWDDVWGTLGETEQNKILAKALEWCRNSSKCYMDIYYK